MCQYHAKADRTTIVLLVEGVARESERLGKMVHYFGVVVECICELLRVRPVTVTEAGIIRRYQTIAIGQAREERLKHPRRRGKSVQQQKRFCIFRPGLSVEDRKAVDLNGAINRGIHPVLLPVLVQCVTVNTKSRSFE